MEYFTTWSGYNSFMAKNPESQILKKLGEDIAVANTVKLNFQRFIKYKEKRMRIPASR